MFSNSPVSKALAPGCPTHKDESRHCYLIFYSHQFPSTTAVTSSIRSTAHVETPASVMYMHRSSICFVFYVYNICLLSCSVKQFTSTQKERKTTACDYLQNVETLYSNKLDFILTTTHPYFRKAQPLSDALSTPIHVNAYCQVTLFTEKFQQLFLFRISLL